MKKTKSSKKIVLKITMSMTGRGIPEISKLGSYKCGELSTYSKGVLTEHGKSTDPIKKELPRRKWMTKSVGETND